MGAGRGGDFLNWILLRVSFPVRGGGMDIMPSPANAVAAISPFTMKLGDTVR